MIEHDNIIYIKDFSELGGVETFTYEMVKKYHDKDIAVVYKTAHINQIKRVKQLVLRKTTMMKQKIMKFYQ